MDLLNSALRLAPRATLRAALAALRPLSQIAALRAFRAIPDDLRYPLPGYVIFEPTLRCDLDCDFCFQRGMHRSGDELSLEQIDELLQRLAPQRLKLIGGELLVRDDALRLIKLAAQHSNSLTITSNGNRLDDPTAKLLSGLANLQRLSLSVTQRQRLDALAPHTRGIARRTPIMAQALVRPQSVESIARACAKLPGMGIRTLLLMLEMWSTPEQVEQSLATLAGRFGAFERGMLHVRTLDRAPYSLAELESALERIGHAARRSGMVTLLEPRYGASRVQRLHEAQEPPAAKVVCSYLIEPALRVDPAGELIFCEHIRLPLGNLLEHDPRQLFNSEPMVNLRRLLLDGDFLPICRRCCKLVHLR
ncbi:MAG: radical SAM protein [Candidatus Alcyoniella australis]|nr:radical SAM protein [Candidatus Alcyoniella australis]